MALMRALVGDQRATKVTGGSPRNPAYWLQQLLGGGSMSATGRHVSPETSLGLVAVFACVSLIAETAGTLPLRVYRRLDPRGKMPDTGRTVYRLLHDQPNPEMSSANLREALAGHVELWGNAYCEIERDEATRIKGLWPLRPDRMQVAREDGEIVYYYQTAGRQRARLEAYRVLHFRGFSPDGLMGYSRIQLAREAIGLGLALEEYGARFFGNSAAPRGALQLPGRLSKEALDRLRESWETVHGGLEQSHRVAILEEGMTWQAVGMPPEDAQFIEARRFQTSEIARLFRVPPHMVGDVDRSTSWGTGIEQQGIAFLVYSLRPRLVRIEQELNRGLGLAPTHFAEHVVDGLLRGDVKSRYDAYAVGRQWGWLSVNDIRELENLNPVDEGDGYLTPLNMTELGSTPPEPATNEQEGAGDAGATDD